ncbi:hypothetical protein [Mesorhizobium sp. M0047]|uniref:hypothetical protein n=1 Tax=Mesorhizobium sp. M0047 TaxID=2956859 RepID=UPI0033375AB1
MASRRESLAGKRFSLTARKRTGTWPSPIGNVGKTFSQTKAKPDLMVVQAEKWSGQAMTSGLDFAPMVEEMDLG